MEMFSSVSEVQRKIRDLEEQHRVAISRLERAELMKKEGAHYYHGTELPIDDAIFSLKEGQIRSVQIALEFYRHTLNTLLPVAPGPESVPLAKVSGPQAPAAAPRANAPATPSLAPTHRSV